MALLQIHTLPHQIPSLSPIVSSSKTHFRNSLFFSTTKVRPFSLSTQPRKLLCKPPLGKYVREDYLVVILLLSSLIYFIFICGFVLLWHLHYWVSVEIEKKKEDKWSAFMNFSFLGYSSLERLSEIVDCWLGIQFSFAFLFLINLPIYI